MEFKTGDKVKVRDTENVRGFNKRAIGHEFVLTDESAKELNHGNSTPADPNNTHRVNYLPTDLEIITTMKNLLETEFVIENCTLSQRLAIKAYCDEKRITYVDLEVPSYKTLTFSDGKFKGFINSVVQRDVITFSELIQFLDNYQPEPEFKVGDHIKLLKVVDGRKVGDIVCITSIQADDSYNNMKDVSVKAKGWINYNANNLDKGGFRWGGNGYYSGDHFRHATPEEIKKWKKENEIKLPKIDGNEGVVEIVVNPHSASDVNLKWGCTTISISTVKELIKVGVNHITLKNLHVVESEIQQIKKFIEHNKL